MDMNRSTPSSGLPDQAFRAGVGWKKYALATAIALVIMAAGAAVGAGVTILYFGHTYMHSPSTPDQATRLITKKLSDAANLSPEERARTEELVGKQMAEVAAIRQKYEEEVARKLGAMTDGISDIIGPERARKCGNWMHRYRGMGEGGHGAEKHGGHHGENGE